MKYQAGDYHGLTEAQIAEMRESGRTRVEYDRHLKGMAYGHCCQAVHHLTLALVWLAIHHPATARRVTRLTRLLATAFSKEIADLHKRAALTDS